MFLIVNLVVVESISVAVKVYDIAPASINKLLDIQATSKCKFTLKSVYDMIKTHS